MSCASCATKASRIADLEDELAEWRRQYCAPDSAVAVEAIEGWRRAFALAPAEALILVCLVQARGRLCSTDRLFAVTRQGSPWSRGDALENPRNLIATRLCLLRRKLKRAGFDAVIQTAWGSGWSIPVAMADRLQTWVDRRGT